ncbi:MAG: hypothetical protein Aurels2KO_47790 [Aureliella sp.]
MPVFATASGQADEQSASGKTPEDQPQGRKQNGQAELAASLSTRIDGLINRLGDDSFHQRRSAQSELMAIGLPAFEKLRLAANLDPNPEVARAARYLLDSQQVRWSLETDSIQVRDVVEHYNTVDEADRRTRFKQLAAIGSSDALFALVRFARFESDEVLSQFATLELVGQLTETFSKNDIDEAARTDSSQTTRELLRGIREQITGSQRESTRWLGAFCREAELLIEGKLPRPSLPTDQWERAASDLSGRIKAEESDPGRQLAIDFHFWLGRWVSQSRDRDAGVRCARPVVDLVQADNVRLVDVTKSLLDAGLPELAIELSERHGDEFASVPSLGFLLAEAHVATGKNDKGEDLAKQSSLSIGQYIRDELKDVRALASADQIEAYRRSAIAGELDERGLFDWCERELLAVVECELRRRKRGVENGLAGSDVPSDMELVGRFQLGNFYWQAGRHAEAASALEPIEKLYAQDTFKKDLIHLARRDDVGSVYHYYAGLAAIDSKNPAKASQHLLEALKYGERDPNPDVVIAFREIADKEPYATQYKELLSGMIEQFRVSLLESERLYASTQRRDMQRSVGRTVAQKCNVLAWLLCCCEVEVEEAVQLSRRSLELAPDDPAYIDTLARCLFASGKFDAAIRTQKRAIEEAPHDRQHQQQLEMFIEARRAAKEAE